MGQVVGSGHTIKYWHGREIDKPKLSVFRPYYGTTEIRTLTLIPNPSPSSSPSPSPSPSPNPNPNSNPNPNQWPSSSRPRRRGCRLCSSPCVSRATPS